jgi:AcrR family transcriptional regulator
MRARAESTAATGERILDAAAQVFWALPTDQISLEEVARRAGVTVQTIIRRFGGREGLLAAGIEREVGRVGEQRAQAPVGDLAGAVHNLLDHYEAMGGAILKLLAEESRMSSLGRIADRGRTVHRAWCGRVFAPALDRVHGRDRERRLAQFVAVCDVYIWKLLRRDCGLSRRQTEHALMELLRPLMEATQ